MNSEKVLPGVEQFVCLLFNRDSKESYVCVCH